jgi:CHASE2 domain-containing sensor protein
LNGGDEVVGKRRGAKWMRPVALAATVGLLAFFGKTDLASDGLSAFTDRDILIRWTSAFAGAARGAIPVTLIDVDAEAMAVYGAPDRAPRRLVAGLIDLAREKGAAGVFLDLDTARPAADPADDAALARVFADWPEQGPPLAVAIRFRGTGAGAGADQSGDGGLVAQPTVFAAALAQRASIVPAASLATADSDGVVRRWRLTQAVCGKDGARAYPSPQLVALLAKDGRARGDLDAFLNWRAQAACGGLAGPRPAWPANPAQDANISYLFSGAPAAPVEAATLPDGRETPVFRRIPARSLIDAKGATLSAGGVSDEPFAGRFVVIGASHAETFDDHLTPIGRLPGAIIVANAVAGAPAILGARMVGPFAKTLVALALFALLATATTRLRGSVAGVVAMVATLTVLPFLGRIFAPSTALEIVATALAMLAAFAALEALLDILSGWRGGLGWRALLKPARGAKAEDD